jgi:tRNA (guanine37-N1)-methyltransferase
MKYKIVFDIITLFPEAFSYFNTSILKKAQEKNIIKINILNLRDFAEGKHKITDDYPYGGGPGMVLKIEPVFKAIEFAKKRCKLLPKIVILTDLSGKIFNQKIAFDLSKYKHIIILCGHYEGVDYRIRKFVDILISVGKYVLTGGELASMIIVDTVSRYIPGVLKNPLSLEDKRFGKLVSIPVYTRPEVFVTPDGKKLRVPKILLSGDHKKIEKWRLKYSKKINL